MDAPAFTTAGEWEGRWGVSSEMIAPELVGGREILLFPPGDVVADGLDGSELRLGGLSESGVGLHDFAHEMGEGEGVEHDVVVTEDEAGAVVGEPYEVDAEEGSVLEIEGVLPVLGEVVFEVALVLIAPVLLDPLEGGVGKDDLKRFLKFGPEENGA